MQEAQRAGSACPAPCDCWRRQRLRESLWGCPGMCFTRSNSGLLGYFQGYLGGGALVVLGYMFREIRIQPSTVGPRTPWEAARGPDGGAGERWPCVISLFIVGISLSSSASPRAAPPGLTTELRARGQGW